MNKTKVFLSEIPSGVAGTQKTLQTMRNIVHKGRGNYDLINVARSIVRGFDQHDYDAEARAIHEFVRDRIRYVRDPVGVETIADPIKTLEIGQGDCDDKSILVAALLDAIGHKTRFVAVGFDNLPYFQHVYVETEIDYKWYAVETTEPVPFGWQPPNPTARMIVNV